MKNLLQKDKEEFRWSAMVECGIAILKKEEEWAYIKGRLLYIAKALKGTRKTRPLQGGKQKPEYARPRMSVAHVALKALKFAMDQKGRRSASHFLHDLEDRLRYGQHGIVAVRLIIRALVRKTRRRQIQHGKTMGSMRQDVFRRSRDEKQKEFRLTL